MSKLPRFHNKHIEKRKYSNSLLAKSISSKVRFSNKTFFNVNLRGSRLRSCSFKNIKIVLSDFSGVILNKNRFTNVHFKSAYFMLLFLEIVALKIAHLKNAFLLIQIQKA